VGHVDVPALVEVRAEFDDDVEGVVARSRFGVLEQHLGGFRLAGVRRVRRKREVAESDGVVGEATANQTVRVNKAALQRDFGRLDSPSREHDSPPPKDAVPRGQQVPTDDSDGSRRIVGRRQDTVNRDVEIDRGNWMPWILEQPVLHQQVGGREESRRDRQRCRTTVLDGDGSVGRLKPRHEAGQQAPSVRLILAQLRWRVVERGLCLRVTAGQQLLPDRQGPSGEFPGLLTRD
jgi:hypothetical protein